jgi:hypothetical protein
MFPQVYVAMGKPVYATIDSLLTLVILAASFWLGLTWFPEVGVLSVCYAWLLIYPLFLVGHLLVIRRLIGLEQGRYWRALGAGFGPVLPISLGLFAVEQVTSGRGLGLLVLPIFALVGIAIYWAYLRWVLSVHFADLLPKRSRGASTPRSQ